ncbi:hypothetical protein [Deinococcus yavapaiensis]|uniref:Tetratricopeptide repeat protein n=1 Tax=Deinococcus yavapaiensis KR-236 TaxID=694435 RepID=A0A318SF17_9DEIO|nr:hypothetical protein [Deinococcus yavapaiensis]PYE56397.1 hypothetical protein DES52_101201 [Deinococcus yavapaiensis KR-236]
MTLVLLPDVGDLLRLSPAYNGATLVEIARFLNASEVLSVTPLDADHPARDAFLAVNLPVHDLAPDWRWAEAEADRLPEFLSQYPQGKERLRDAGRQEAALRDALSVPLSPSRVRSADLLAAVKAYHDGVRDALGEGPGTAHRERRLTLLAEILGGRSGVVFAALDDVPDLLERLEEATLPDLATFTPGEASRLRALADRALRLEEGDDFDALVAALLREEGDAITPKAELQYAAANVYFAVGDLTSARELLESAAHATVDARRSVVGLILARLGQVRDALGDRDLAKRAYQAVQALTAAPTVARETAAQGLKAPFQLDV